MSHSQFHSIKCLYLDMHGLIFETSIWLLAGSTRFLSYQPTSSAIADLANRLDKSTKGYYTMTASSCDSTVTFAWLPMFEPHKQALSTEASRGLLYTAQPLVLLESIPFPFVYASSSAREHEARQSVKVDYHGRFSQRLIQTKANVPSNV